MSRKKKKSEAEVSAVTEEALVSEAAVLESEAVAAGEAPAAAEEVPQSATSEEPATEDVAHEEAPAEFSVVVPDGESLSVETEEVDATPKITDREQIEQVLEAIIFAAPKAISLLRLRNLLNHFHYDTTQLSEILDEMRERSSRRGFQLIKVAGGYQYRSHPEHAEVLQRLLEDKPARLSASALEVLAIIAYKQPISRAEIDSVRGVDSGHLLKGLLEKNLVRTVGHAETPGRPLLYGSAPYFLEVFNLGSLDDLPALDELSRELQPTGQEGSSDTLVLAAEPGALVDSSGLGSVPDRGAFDEIGEETPEAADFGSPETERERESEASSA